MKCKRAETLISKALDGLLTNKEEEALQRHLKECPACQKRKEEYSIMIETLRDQDFPQVKSYFWERLHTRLKEKREYDIWFLWKRWSLRAVPLSIVAVVILALGLVLFLPQPTDELSQTEALLLQDHLPYPESLTFLEEEGAENRSMQIIFTAMEEKQDTRRYFP
jgi:predicted anti-sigma-YlaC factor YlaD